MIDVVLPVGPFPNDKKWLPEALDGIRRQTLKPGKVIVINDDARDLTDSFIRKYLGNDIKLQHYFNPVRLGCADSWNIGIYFSHGLAFMMGADDWLEPECLEACYEAYMQAQDNRGYYFVSIEYCNEDGTKTGEIQDLACNAAMVTKGLWQHLGGFPPLAGLGAPDGLIVSVLMGQGSRAGNLRPVRKGVPLYNVRRHAGQETARTGGYQEQIVAVRNIYTRDWQPAV